MLRHLNKDRADPKLKRRQAAALQRQASERACADRDGGRSAGFWLVKWRLSADPTQLSVLLSLEEEQKQWRYQSKANKYQFISRIRAFRNEG